MTASHRFRSSSTESTSFTSKLTIWVFHFGRLWTLSGMSSLALSGKAASTLTPASAPVALGLLKSWA